MTAGTAPVFRVRAQPGEGYSYLWLYISRSPQTDYRGLIGSDVELEQFSVSAPGSDLYDAKPFNYDYPGFWMNTPGVYYWQAYRISYAGSPDGAVEGPVRSFKIAAPPTPKPVPTPAPPPANPYAGLIDADIPLWVAARRNGGGFVASTDVSNLLVPQARWLAILRTTAARWGLNDRGAVSRPVTNGDYENQVGFGYDLTSDTLGETVTTSVRRYRRVRVCRRVHTRGGRSVRRCKRVRRYAGRSVIDRDITFNTVSPYWEAGPAYPAANRYDLETVVIHEMGHFAGNGHRPYCENSPMVEAIDTGEWWRSDTDHHWIGCGYASTARAKSSRERGLLRTRNIDIDVRVDASPAEVRQATNKALQQARDQNRRRAASHPATP